MIRPACPRCATELSKRAHRGIMRYSCTNCHGFAIEGSLLDQLMDQSELAELWRGLGQASDGTLKCSHCRESMKVVHKDHGVRQLELDICARCRILWLDNGEGQDLSSLETTAVLKLETAGQVPIAKTLLALLGLPVEQDNDFFHRTPYVTWLLIALCSLVSLWAFTDMDFALKTFGHFSGKPFPVNVLTAFTSFFIHASWPHLLFNMYFFWIFGDNVEDNLGKFKYLLLVFGAALIGDTLADFLDPRLADIPGVGASGGISGLIAYYLIRFPYRRFVFMIFFRMFTIPAVYFGALYLVKELVGAFTQMGGVSSVSHLAHLGGAVAGAILAFWPARSWVRGNAK